RQCLGGDVDLPADPVGENDEVVSCDPMHRTAQETDHELPFKWEHVYESRLAGTTVIAVSGAPEGCSACRAGRLFVGDSRVYLVRRMASAHCCWAFVSPDPCRPPDFRCVRSLFWPGVDWALRAPRHEWQIAMASASAASAGFGGASRPRIRVTMVVTCFLSARPEPVIAALTSEGVCMATGSPRRAASPIVSPET